MPLILSSGGISVTAGGVFTSDQFAILRDLNLIALGSIGTSTSSETSSVEPYPKLGPTFGQLHYIQTMKGVGPNLITSLVNAPQDIIIYGVDDASQKSLGGPTGLGDTSMDADQTITVLYDASACSGYGSFVFDNKGKKILDPPFIILAHELAHALHFSNGTITPETPESVAEALAIAVENQIRAEASALYQQMTGQSANLSQRDPNNHGGGCNPPDQPPPAKPPQNPWELKCFIATAACGSPYADEVQALRRFRDDYLRTTRIGSVFFERFYSEYYLYSPVVASAMEESAALAATVRNVLVDPFFAFLRVLDWYFMKDERGDEFAGYVHEVLGRTKVPDGDQSGAEIVQALEKARASLGGPERLLRVTGLIRPPVAVNPAIVIEYLSQAITARTMDRRYSLWVLVEPLLLHWSVVRSCASGASRQDVADTYCQGIASWLGSLPSLASFEALPGTELLDELCRLRQIIFRSEESRQQLGQYLMRDSDSVEMPQILAQAGYL